MFHIDIMPGPAVTATIMSRVESGVRPVADAKSQGSAYRRWSDARCDEHVWVKTKSSGNGSFNLVHASTKDLS
jgi:hypothetical protein